MKTTWSVSVFSENYSSHKSDNQKRNCGGLTECEMEPESPEPQPPLICCATTSSSSTSSKYNSNSSLNFHNYHNKGHGHSSASSSTSSHFLPLQMIHLSTAILILLCLVFTPGLADSQLNLGEGSILANSTGHHHHSRPNPNNHNHHSNGSSSSTSSGGGGGGHHGGHGHGHGNGHGNGHHRCYVCLPPDRREAEDILSIFPTETRPQIPDCSSFGGYQSVRQYAFRCPQNYAGCLLRIHGENITRSCAKFGLNDCKTANKVELCYCTGNLCNYKKPEKLEEETQSHQPVDEEKESDSEERAKARLSEEKEEAEARKFEEGDTDDEDLLQPHNEQPWEGSGTGKGDGCEDGHGVLCQETTTPKPTLIPNLRPTPSTTPSATAAASSLFTSAFLPLPFLSILFTFAYGLVTFSWRGGRHQ